MSIKNQIIAQVALTEEQLEWIEHEAQRRCTGRANVIAGVIDQQMRESKARATSVDEETLSYLKRN